MPWRRGEPMGRERGVRRAGGVMAGPVMAGPGGLPSHCNRCDPPPCECAGGNKERILHCVLPLPCAPRLPFPPRDRTCPSLSGNGEDPDRARPKRRPPGRCVCLWQPAGAAPPYLAPEGTPTAWAGLLGYFLGVAIAGLEGEAGLGARRWVLRARGQQRALSSLRCVNLSSQSFLSRK